MKKILIIDNETTLIKKLQKLIPGSEIVKKPNKITKKDFKHFDLIVLSGGHRYSVNHSYPILKEEVALIRSGKPIIGICFGCQLIAKAFGGDLYKLKTKRRGIKSIKFLDKRLSKKSSIKVFESHRYSIKTVPKEIDVLAKSKDGPEIIKHKTLPIYGFQFHPEKFVSKTEGDKVFLKVFYKILSDK